MENQENTIIIDNNYCRKCGVKNDINNNFCPNCGNVLKQENQQSSDLTEQNPEEKKDPNKKNYFIMFLGIIALIPFLAFNTVGIAIMVLLAIIYAVWPNIREVYYIILYIVGITFLSGAVVLLILYGTCSIFLW